MKNKKGVNRFLIKDKKGDSRFLIKDKKGMELSITTIILLVLGILVLIGLILAVSMGWDNFKTQIGAILGSDVAQARKTCDVQCSLDNSYDYCCGEKEVNDDLLTCSDSLLDVDCEIDCSVVSCGGSSNSPPMP